MSTRTRTWRTQWPADANDHDTTPITACACGAMSSGNHVCRLTPTAPTDEEN